MKEGRRRRREEGREGGSMGGRDTMREGGMNGTVAKTASVYNHSYHFFYP